LTRFFPFLKHARLSDLRFALFLIDSFFTPQLTECAVQRMCSYHIRPLLATDLKLVVQLLDRIFLIVQVPSFFSSFSSLLDFQRCFSSYCTASFSSLLDLQRCFSSYRTASFSSLLDSRYILMSKERKNDAPCAISSSLPLLLSSPLLSRCLFHEMPLCAVHLASVCGGSVGYD
jgi:hypothetical protein